MYELINPINLDQLSKLKRHEIAFPDITYTNQELNRKKTTLKAAYTNINKEATSKYINDLEWDKGGNIVWQNQMLKYLAEKINEFIKSWKVSQDNDELLKKIFVYIQLWGGNTSRNFFNKNGGFEEHFNIEIYREAVNSIMSNISVSDGLEPLLKLKQMGISFATKHVFFWSENKLPIYDNIISMIVFGRTPLNNVQHYIQYINALEALSSEKKVESFDIERCLFNWYDTNAGQKWFCIRKNNK